MSARYDYPFQYREKLVGRGWWYWLRSKVCNGLPKVGPRNLKQKVMTGREKKIANAEKNCHFNARGRCTAHVQNFSRQVGGKQECSAVGEWSFAEERTAIYENMNFGG